MSITQGATDVIGGGGYGFGGFGGIAPIGLIGLNTFLGNGWNNGWNQCGDGRGLDRAGITVLEQNVSDLRKDVADNGKEIHVLGNEIAGMFAQQNLAMTGEFRNLDNQICETEKVVVAGNHALSLQGFQNTQAIQAQMTNFQHSVDNQFCAVKEQISADGQATRALITQNLIDDLRSELDRERRGRDNREIEINVQNNATQTQAVLQAQQQQQTQYLSTLLGSLGDQVNRATNSVINVGSGLVAGSQSNSNANTKVNG